MILAKCDGCGVSADVKTIIQWLKLERFEAASTLTFGEDPGPWHFCNTTCLSEWMDKE